MNHTDRLAPLVAGVLIAVLIVAGIVSAAADFAARLNGLAL